jgi:hypothetical protein
MQNGHSSASGHFLLVAVLMAVGFCRELRLAERLVNGCLVAVFGFTAIEDRLTFPGLTEHSRGQPGVKAALKRAASRSWSLDTGPYASAHLPISGECQLFLIAYLEAEAIRSTTDCLCAGDR